MILRLFHGQRPGEGLLVEKAVEDAGLGAGQFAVGGGAGPAAARAMDAERLADESRQAAVVAIAALEHSMVEVDGVVYLLQKGIEHGTARIVSFVPEGRA